MRVALKEPLTRPSAPVEDEVMLAIAQFVKELDEVPHQKATSLGVELAPVKEPDRVASVELGIFTPSVLTVALGSCPPSPPTDRSQLVPFNTNSSITACVLEVLKTTFKHKFDRTASAGRVYVTSTNVVAPLPAVFSTSV